MQRHPLNLYESASRETMTGRELEASVLTRAAVRLKKCLENREGPDHEERIFEALRYNQQLWTLFQTELAKPENPLPTDLKVNILRLSAFIDRRIFEAMADPQPEKLKILIEMNLNMAAALRGSPSP